MCLTICCLLAASYLNFAYVQPPKASSTPGVARKTTRAVTPATYTGRQLMVGSGGGFTGASTTYYLLDNGQLFSQDSFNKGYRLLGRQTTSTTQRSFTTVETKGQIKKVRFNNPGNTYKFVGWKKGKRQYKVTWGAAGDTVPALYPKFYNSFMRMISATDRLN